MKMDSIRKAAWNIMTALAGMMLISMVVSKAMTGWSSVFSYRMFYIMSESMEPAIAENQLVIGKLLPADEVLQVGGIYAYRKEGAFGTEIIIHRLIEITNDEKYRFQGDNNTLPDEELVERGDVGYTILGANERLQ